MEDMFQKKIDELFSVMPNVFGIADAIVIVDFDEWGKDHYEMLEKVLWICRQAKLRPNKEKYLFRL